MCILVTARIEVCSVDTRTKGSLFLVAGLALALCSSGSSSTSTPVEGASLDERIILVRPSGVEREDREISIWQDRIVAAQAAKQSIAGNYERLGWAYISKARRTLDAGYYKLAEKTAEVMDARFGPTDEALLLRGHVYHNLHRFGEAEAVARELVAKRGIAFDYALLSDALMEQGKLSESVVACQKMMALKPGVDAYSRAANLRWLTGDLDGAIEAMEAAVRAGSPLDATDTAWTLTRLSSYYLQAGRTNDALRVVVSAESLVSEYPPALLAKGRALLAQGRAAEAVPPLEKAVSLNPLPEYQWWLADALRAEDKPDQAIKVETDLQARGEVSDPRTFSLYLATRREDPAHAVRMATAELTNRDDAFTRDALAWALDSAGDVTGAESAIQEALSAHTKDARLYLHAGQIALDVGNAAAARTYFELAKTYAGTLTPSERSLLDSRLKPQGAPPGSRQS
jgi:tetratricopeptide (TPR) repeat protein